MSGRSVKVYHNGHQVNMVPSGFTIQVSTQYTVNYSIKIKRLYNGNSAPATSFMYAMEKFELLNWKQCAEGLNYYNERLYARHMKRQTKAKGTKKTWTKEYRNNKFNW